MGEDDAHASLREKGVLFLHVAAENSLEKYETADRDVRTWLRDVVRVFEREDIQPPVLLHCRSGKDRTGVAIAAILLLLGVPEALVIKEFVLSKGAPEANLRTALAGFCKSGGIEAYLTADHGQSAPVDVGRVRAYFLGTGRESGVGEPEADADAAVSELRWLRQEVELACRLAQAATKSSDDDEAAYWHREAVKAAAEVCIRVTPSGAAVALYYHGYALSKLQRYAEARESLAVGLAMARRAEADEASKRVAKRLEKELNALPQEEEEEVDISIVGISEIADTPGDPYQNTWLLTMREDVRHGWSVLPCPGAFAWLRCGELAASATPSARHLPALQALALKKRVGAEQVGAPRPPEEHWQDVVGQIGSALSGGAGCLVHCRDGFGLSGVALACFLVVYGLDEPVRAGKPGKPQLTAGEAIEVLRALRPGSIADPDDEVQIHAFAQAAWARHIENAQRAFRAPAVVRPSPQDDAGYPSAADTSGTAAQATAKRPAPSSARVVKQPGDGNCLFHSLAHGIGGTNAASLRGDICGFMEKHPDLCIAGTSLAEWIQMLAGSNIVQYARKMAKSAQWGGAPEIAACAHMKHINIHVYERRGSGFELTVPFDVGGSRTISVLYVGGVHYDALVI